MIRKNRFILILFFLYFIVNVQAQSYYADKTFGIGVSSGLPIDSTGSKSLNLRCAMPTSQRQQHLNALTP